MICVPSTPRRHGVIILDTITFLCWKIIEQPTFVTPRMKKYLFKAFKFIHLNPFGNILIAVIGYHQSDIKDQLSKCFESRFQIRQSSLRPYV
uniref:Uncharacterized protein n=1 Tax=Rhizophora mucronata TaxID=61149 RepID=A0A2P2KNX9_RHIMU